MRASNEEERRGLDRHTKCPECGAARASDQRYCLECGARLDSLPAAIAAQLDRFRKFATDRIPVIRSSVADAEEKGANRDEAKGWPFVRSDFMPSPRAAAVAVIGMLALGVALGSATGQLARSAGLTTILLEEPSPPEARPRPQIAAEPVPEAEEPSEPAAATPPAIPQEAPLGEEPLPTEPEHEVPVIEEELPTGLPEVKHVFVIMLGENGYEETFGERSQSQYLAKELPAQGELLPNYFAVTAGELANQIALISGQGPTPETAAGCPSYADVTPGTESPEGQIEGNGCLYPATTKTLPGQMTEAGLTWRAYVEEPEDAAQQEGCAVTPSNPFVYFHSIVDDSRCAESDVGLPQLSKDLRGNGGKFPALAYILPDGCHKGDEEPCPEGTPTGLAASEEFLKTVLPAIQESFAYKDGGLIAITSAQAPQEGESADSSGCCIAPDYPNTPADESQAVSAGPVKEGGGGGRVGALLLSPLIEAGTTSETYFNHFSLLATIEELFGLEKIGYAAEPAITGFDESIFNAGG